MFMLRTAPESNPSLFKLEAMPKKSNSVDPRRYSRVVVEGVKQTPSRAMLRAVGFADADFDKPQVGIASTWSNLTPCNMHIDELARMAAGGAETPSRYPTAFRWALPACVTRWYRARSSPIP